MKSPLKKRQKLASSPYKSKLGQGFSKGLSKATGLVECTLFGITGAGFSDFSLPSRRFQLPASRPYDK